MAAREDLGAELRTLRAARGLTLVEAARRAGVSRKSLHRWEAGEHAPGAEALLRLLDGLGAEARDRSRLVGAADPNRAQPALRDAPLGPLVHPGLVLRSLRESRGLTQADLARRAGVGQPSVAKWEAGLAMPGEEPLARALAALGALDAGLREDALDLYDPVTDPLEARLRLREDLGRVPRPFQGAHLLAMERELWPLAARDARWEAALVEAMSWRSEWLFEEGAHTDALEVARRALRLAEDSGEWDAARMAFNTLGEVRSSRGADGASLARFYAEGLPRFRNPFVRAGFLHTLGEHVGHEDRPRARALLASFEELVSGSEPDDLFGGHPGRNGSYGVGERDLDRFALWTALAWGDRDEAARVYERAFAPRWEAAIRTGGLGLLYVRLHRLVGEAPSERARAVIQETWGSGADRSLARSYNREIAPWLGTDPLPLRPVR